LSLVKSRLIAAPLILSGLLGAALLRQPGDHSVAYGSSDSAIYSATLVSSPAPVATPPINTVHQVSTDPTHVTLQPAIAAQPPAPVSLAAFDLRGQPTISVSQIDQVLGDYGSPMAGMGQTIYDLGVKYGIDPAYCLAFFVHESAAGTRGEAVLTHSVGNIRAQAGFPSKDGYKYYDTWQEGADDWYHLISTLYIGSWNLTTVDKIVPVYAPSADSNDPAAYVNDVEQLVTAWRAQA
jgi:hypothetical protein